MSNDVKIVPLPEPVGQTGVLPADGITVDQSTTTMPDAHKTVPGVGTVEFTNPVPSQNKPLVDKVAGRDAVDADQGSTPTVDLMKTTGSLWARNEEAARVAFEENNPAFEVNRLRAEALALEQKGSVIYDADAKKAALGNLGAGKPAAKSKK